MPMKVEAAVVTGKQSDAAFNADSININGKTFPEEVIKNGYKGSGVVSGNVHFALASSAIEGFAGATVRAFEERAKKFRVTRDPKNVFSGFFEDCRSALLNLNKQEDELVCACLYASGRTLTVAGNGNTGMYALRFGSCAPVVCEKAENTVADFNLAVISDVSENDIYILLSPGVAGALSAKDVEDICKISDGSVKRIVSLISKVALGNGAAGAVTVIAVKVLETAAEEELSAAGFMPDFAAMEKMLYGDNNDTVKEENESSETVENTTDASENETEIEPVSVNTAEEYIENNESAEQTEADMNEVNEESDNADEADADADEAQSSYAENTEDDVEDNAADAEGDTEKSDKKTRIMLFTILGVMFTVSVVLIGLIAVELFADKNPAAETTVNFAEETTVEETTEEESIEESTSEEETTEEEVATNNEEETTKSTPVNVPATSVTTTKSQQTTQAPAVQTTKAPAEETTVEQTSAEQTTEKAPEETTAADIPEADTSSSETENTETENTVAQQTDASADA